MKIAYFDCIAGASGDMLLGALVDAGWPEADLRERLDALHLDGFDLRVRRVLKRGIGATKVDVLVSDETTERHLREIEAIIRASALPAPIQDRAVAIFRRMCEVEARIHGASPDQVHLHELGGIDTIVDVTGVLSGLDALGIQQVHVSPLPMGRGMGRSAHGPLPLPAPATLALLEGAPLAGSELEMELVTPTGAALLSSLAAGYGQIPDMRLLAVGYGAGTRDLPIPNVLRVLVGETKPAPGHEGAETVAVLETNLDDMNPELYEHVMARLFGAGALDVFLSPIQMKKNRPGTLLRAMCRPTDVGGLVEVLFAETSTLGVRHAIMARQALERTIREVQTPYGAVRVKVARWSGGAKMAPEYDDCRRLAESHGVPLREVYRSAERAAEADVASWSTHSGESP